MYNNYALAIFASVCLSIPHANALPAARPEPAATYNVVDVGGPSTIEEAPTVYQTIKETAPAQTITQVQAAATVTERPDGPIIPHVVKTTSIEEWTVIVEVTQTISEPTSSCTSITSSPSTSCTSTPSTSTLCTSTPSTSKSSCTRTSSATTTSATTTSVAPKPYVPISSARWQSTTSCSRSTPSQGLAAPTGSFLAPWNSTGSYTHRGFALPSGVQPSSITTYTPSTSHALGYRSL